MLRASPFFVRLFIGLLRPKHTVLGMDFAGTVEVAGAGVTSFEPGARVFGMSPSDFGAHAEYLCVPEKGDNAAMPAGVRFGEAVVYEGAFHADTILRKFGLKAGHKILIYGAFGAIGTAALQLAKSYGAEVTAVAAARHLDLVGSLGTDRAVDYTAEDFGQIGETFDFVLHAVGKTTYFRCRKLLKPDGVFAATDFGPGWLNAPLAIWSSITGRNRVVFPIPKGIPGFADFLKAPCGIGEFMDAAARDDGDGTGEAPVDTAAEEQA